MSVDYSSVAKCTGAKQADKFWIKYRWMGEKRFVSATDKPESYDYVAITDGESSSTYKVSSKQVSVSKGREQSLDSDTFINTLGIPLSDAERASVDVSDLLLPTALNAKKMQWSLKPTLDVVDGAKCHVIEANTGQRIWVDVSGSR